MARGGTLTGVATFTYKASDGALESAPVTVTIYVNSLTDGRIAYWPLDDGAGTTAVDASGFNHPGTLLNGPTWVAGKVNGALHFDGSDDCVEVNLPSLSPPWSAAMWVKREDSTQNNARLTESTYGSLRLEQFSGTNKLGVTQYGTHNDAFTPRRHSASGRILPSSARAPGRLFT